MKTYEGSITVKWHKNDIGIRRPITIDCESKEEMQRICNEVKTKFLEMGEDPLLAEKFVTHRLVGVPAMSVKFDISERK